MRANTLIRSASLQDLQAITDIYNHAIRSTTSTFDVEEKSIEDRRLWLESHSEQYPIIVATVGGEVVGWGSLSPYADRKAYEHTVENAVYVRDDIQARGIGRAILKELIALASRLGYHCIIAQVVGGNKKSLRLHERQGFQRVGLLKEVGWKFGKWLDLVVMQKML